MKHPSADDIQEYLDGISGAEARVLESHLAECADCRARFEEYRDLYAGLGDGRAIPEIRDLPYRVMSRIEAWRSPTKESALEDWVLAICGVLLPTIALVVFVGIGSLAVGLVGLAGGVRDLAVRSMAGPRPTVIAAAAVVVLLVYLANGIALRRARSGSRRS